jgi:hypothetical protein
MKTSQEFGKMRKQVIAAATAIVLGIATTASGTIALARGGGGGHGGGGGGGHGGGGHGGGFGGGGHGFGGRGFGGHGLAMGHSGIGGHGVAIGGFGHSRFDGRRFGRGFYAYGGDYGLNLDCDLYYYPDGCDGISW